MDKFYTQAKKNVSRETTKDPICGMTLDVSTALNIEHDGLKLYFCGDHCLQKFLSTQSETKSVSKSANLYQEKGY